MVVGRQLPRHVIVWLACVPRIALCSQQIHRVVAVGLVEPYDIGARGERTLPEGEVRHGTLHLDPLREQPCEQLCDAGRIALPVGNEERIGRLLEPLAP